MSKVYTRYDWASDRLAKARWVDEEERLLSNIDKRTKKANKLNKKNHRNYA